MMTSANFYQAIGPFVVKTWGDGREKLEKQYSQIFNVSDTTDPYRRTVEYGGTGVLTKKFQGAPVLHQKFNEGMKKQYEAVTWAGSAQITMEALQDLKSKAKELARGLMDFGYSTEQTPEYICGLILDRAFNSSYPLTGDGKELCSESHTTAKGGTQSNAFTTTPQSLSESGIEQMMINLRTVKGPDGMLKPRSLKSIVVPSALAIRAEKLNLTKKQVGSFNNDVSVVAGTKVIVFDYLVNQTRWFGLTDKNTESDGLFFEFRSRPDIIFDDLPGTLSKLIVAWFRSITGVGDFRCIWGSAATS